MRISDILAFLAVKSCGSFTGAARELRVTTSQISKATTRLEQQLHVRLLTRGAKGVTLSTEGKRVAPAMEQIVSRLRQLGREDADGASELTVAAPSWLVTQLLPCIASAHPELRVRGLELPPALIRAYAAENFFDMTLLTRDVERLPGTWNHMHVGEVRKALFARPAFVQTLGAAPLTPERLREVPFICPIYHRDGQFVLVDDDCPLPLNERRIGHQTQTIGLALELATLSDQVVFGPAIAAKRHVKSGALIELRVEGWNVNEPLYVVCNGDRVLARVQKGVGRALRAALES